MISFVVYFIFLPESFPNAFALRASRAALPGCACFTALALYALYSGHTLNSLYTLRSGRTSKSLIALCSGDAL